jgi:hypothetical protein
MAVFQDKRHAFRMGGTPNPDISQNPINDDLKAKCIRRDRTPRGRSRGSITGVLLVTTL